MPWAETRRRLMRACLLMTPILTGIGAFLFPVFLRDHRFDVWHWVILGAFNGIIIGLGASILLRLVIFCVDKAKGFSSTS